MPSTKEYMREWRRTNPEKRWEYELRRYGLTEEQYDAMVVAQGGACRICRKIPLSRGGSRVLQIDHDHKTGKVRGLLCHHCNMGLGRFYDSPGLLMAAAEYLRR